MSEHSATDSPYTFRDRSARRLTRKQQESIGSERSPQATPCRKRKRLSDDSAFGDSGAETEDEAPPARRQRTTQDVWVEIDESDHSHPSPFEPSVQLSPEIQQWENMLQALQGSTPLRWTASDESRVDRAFAELVEVVGILPLPASIQRSIPASLREKFPQGKQGINQVEWECLSVPPASKSTSSELELDIDQWISIPGESTGSVDGCDCGWLEMCGEPIKIGIDEKHIWNQKRFLSFGDIDGQVWGLHDIDLSGNDPDLESGKPLPPTVGAREIEEAWEEPLAGSEVEKPFPPTVGDREIEEAWQESQTRFEIDLSRKDPDVETERPSTPPGAREIEEAWQESLARFEKNRANLKSLRNDMEVDHRYIIANDAYREGVILEQKQLDDGTCPGYSNGFWTLPKPVLRNLEWQKVLDEDEARDGKPSKTFIKASKSIKRENVTPLTAFEDEMVKEISVEQDQQDVRGGDELGSSCLAFGGGVVGELSSRQLLFEDCDAS